MANGTDRSPRTLHPRRKHLGAAALLILLVAVAHSLIPTDTAERHHLHVLLRLAYLVPVALAAVGSGAAGGVAAALAVSLIQAAHILSAWAHLPLENSNQLAFVSVYWLVGPLVGALVDRERRAEKARLLEEQRLARQALLDALQALEFALSYRDEGTARHGEEVASLAVELAEHVGLPPDQVEVLHLAGRMHDLGKIGVRDDVLYKESKLSRSERMRIERHPDIAADILAAVPGAAQVAEIVRAHHEFRDGSGYPRGLSGAEIPVEAQILTVADVFCALTERRSYHEGWSSKAALDLLESWTPHRVDESLVWSLRAIVGESAPRAQLKAEQPS